MDVVTQREDQKVTHYRDTVHINNGTFSPFIVSADGLHAPQAQEVMNTVSRSLAAKIKGAYSDVLHGLHLRLNLLSYEQVATF